MMLHYNFANMKGKYLKTMDKLSIYTHPDTESLIGFAIIMAGIMLSALAVSSYNLKTVQSQVDLENVRLLQRMEANRHTETERMETNRHTETEIMEANRHTEIERMEANRHTKAVGVAVANSDILKLEYELRIAETMAATNPYVMEAKHSVSPVNLFIDSSSSYTIQTSDGKTEISISMVKVNGTTYTPEQRKLMTMAFHIGKKIGYPETIQALLLQETLAGAFGDRIGDTNLRVGKRSYGVMQMKVATAKKVLNNHKELIANYFPSRKTYKRLRDEEIIIKLIQDDEFNIRLAALNFEIHRKSSKSWAQAVVAYNTGQGAANHIKQPKKHKYYGHILKRVISEVRPFNQKTKLTL